MASTAPPATAPSFEHTLELATHKLRMLPAPRSDARECAIIFHEAFSQDMIFAAMHGTADHDACVEKTVAYFDNDWETPGRRWFKIVDENNGKIAAFGKWWFPHTPAPADPNAPEPTYLDGENKEISEYFMGALKAGREKYITDKENMYFMNILAVRPEYQRLGLGAALLAPVLKQADQEGRKTYIEASAKGLGLYKKLGWKEVETLESDLTKCPGLENEPVHKTVLMMREPVGDGLGL